MQMIQSIIDQVFLYDEDAKEVEDYIYRGMMAGLNDPYSVYYNANDYKALQDSTSRLSPATNVSPTLYTMSPGFIPTSRAGEPSNTFTIVQSPVVLF